MDHYRVLGILKNASQSEIDEAFEKLKQGRPGQSAKQIHKAYFWLGDPERRKEYDQKLEIEKSLKQERGSNPAEAMNGGHYSSNGVLIQTPIYFKNGVFYRDKECSLPFYDQEAAETLWIETPEQKQQAEERRRFEVSKALFHEQLAYAIKVVIYSIVVGALIFGGMALWQRVDDSGYVPHDEMTIVYSPEWQYGEYKNCTTINGAREQNILCEGGVPSGRTEDGRVFKVRFWGRTFDSEKAAVGGAPNVAPAVFYWNCRKNEGSDPSITCAQRKTDDLSSHP